MDLPAKQRHKNVKGAFSVKYNSSVLKNKQVCIVDDVMTTANTVNEVAKCLKEAGVGKVGVWSIARVA
jgi:predicted amidophosphoribosyltransferase